MNTLETPQVRLEFFENFTEALSKCDRLVTEDELYAMVVDYIANPEMVIKNPEIDPIVQFVRTRLKNREILTAWFIEDYRIFRKAVDIQAKNIEYETAFQELVRNKNVTYSCEFKNRFSREQMLMVVRRILLRVIQGVEQDISVADMTSVEVTIYRKDGHVVAEFDINLKFGKISEEMDICAIMTEVENIKV